jgi:hypothetical protein
MFPAMVMARPRLSTVVGPSPIPDDDDVSELIDVSVVPVMIEMDRARTPVMIVPRPVVIIIAATTARLRLPTRQHEGPDAQGDSYQHFRLI